MQAVDLQADAPARDPDGAPSGATKKSRKRTRHVATAMQAPAQQGTPARQHAQHGGQRAQQEEDAAIFIPDAASEGTAAPSRDETTATAGATSGTTRLLLLQLSFVG